MRPRSSLLCLALLVVVGCDDSGTSSDTSASSSGAGGGSTAITTAATGSTVASSGSQGGAGSSGTGGGPSCPPETWDLAADYGMTAADAKPAVDAALLAARAWLTSCGPDSALVLSFPAGDWNFVHPSGPAIEIADIDATMGRLTLRGVDRLTTSLVFTKDNERGIELRNAHRVTIEHLHLTRDKLFTSQGVVVSAANGVITFDVEAGFPNPAELAAKKNALDNDRTLIKFTGPDSDPRLAPKSVSYKLRQPDPRVCPNDLADCPPAIVETTPGRFDAFLENPNTPLFLNPGDRVALKAKVGENTVRADDCDDLSLKHLKITRNSAATVSVGGNSNRTLVDDLNIERSDAINGKVPFFAGPGGGPQVSAQTDGPTIINCSIVGTTDDAIAVFSSDSTSPSALMSGALIEGNFVRDTQGRSINITHSRDGVCRKNILRRGQNPSIQLKNNQTADYPGSMVAVTGWIIQENELDEPWTYPAILLTQEQSNIFGGLLDGNQIIGNTIISASANNPVVEVRHTKSVDISGNIIQSFSTADDYQDNGLPDPVPLVYVVDAESVTGMNNKCEPMVTTTRPDFVANGAAVVTLDWDCPG